MTFWGRFILAALATWRIAHLLVHEDGPADLARKLRELAEGSFAGHALGCFGCLSLWVALPFATYASVSWRDTAVAWLALSGAAYLVEQLRPEPLVIERLVNTKGDSDGVLRSEIAGDQPDAAGDGIPHG